VTRTEQRIAELEDQLAELTAEVGNLREQAFILRSLEEIRVMRAGDTYSAVPARRPRHLQLVGGAR
jgi:hypothetical protein